jgi:rubrerythrin
MMRLCHPQFLLVSKMPPKAVKTLRDLIFWQYAKIISESARIGKKQFQFVMNRFKKLQSGEIRWSTTIREFVREREKIDECIYCGSREHLTKEHILPLSRGGPDHPDNVVWVCRRCNSSKGDKRLYEWYGLERRYEVPRVAEGKYLKLLYSLLEIKGLLFSTPPAICPFCDLGQKCPRRGELTVYCLEGTFCKSESQAPKDARPRTTNVPYSHPHSSSSHSSSSK